MSAPEAAAKPPAWHRHLDADGYGFAWLLGLILLSLGFQLAAPDDAWARGVTIALQGSTLQLALRVSGANRLLIRISGLGVLVAVLGSFGLLAGSGELSAELGRALPLLMVLLAPPAIVVGIVRQARRSGGVTVRTMFGVLCIYLLVGAAFAYAYGFTASVSDQPFFAEIDNADQADFLYFSFTTLTTTGYGDLTAAHDVGRSFAIAEALFGQIYLVTVVALIVANMRPARARAR